MYYWVYTYCYNFNLVALGTRVDLSYAKIDSVDSFQYQKCTLKLFSSVANVKKTSALLYVRLGIILNFENASCSVITKTTWDK